MDILSEIRRVIELESRAVTRLLETIGPAYEEAVHLLYACPGKVILTGIGKSGIIAQKIASTMVSTGMPALFLHPTEGMHGDIGIARKDDIIIAIGRSGESEEIIALLPSIRKIGAHLCRGRYRGTRRSCHRLRHSPGGRGRAEHFFDDDSANHESPSDRDRSRPESHPGAKDHGRTGEAVSGLTGH